MVYEALQYLTVNDYLPDITSLTSFLLAFSPQNLAFPPDKQPRAIPLLYHSGDSQKIPALLTDIPIDHIVRTNENLDHSLFHNDPTY